MTLIVREMRPCCCLFFPSCVPACFFFRRALSLSLFRRSLTSEYVCNVLYMCVCVLYCIVRTCGCVREYQQKNDNNNRLHVCEIIVRQGQPRVLCYARVFDAAQLCWLTWLAAAAATRTQRVCCAVLLCVIIRELGIVA